jgi:hypothetical protein
MLYVVCCMLYAACCMLYAVCCMLYAVCCMAFALQLSPIGGSLAPCSRPGSLGIGAPRARPSESESEMESENAMESESESGRDHEGARRANGEGIGTSPKERRQGLAHLARSATTEIHGNGGSPHWLVSWQAAFLPASPRCFSLSCDGRGRGENGQWMRDEREVGADSTAPVVRS